MTDDSIRTMSSQRPVSLKDWFMMDKEYFPLFLLDGGVSTHLQDILERQRGVDPRNVWSHRSLWSSSLLLTEQGRSDIEQGHLDWLQAGSNIITTVTYQCHYASTLPNTKHDDSVDDATTTQMFRDGVRLAKRAISSFSEKTKGDESDPHFVVASSGCFGAALANGAEYTGDYPGVTEEDLMTFHRCKLEVLFDEKPDGIALETIPSLFEFVAVLKLLREFYQRQANLSSVAIWMSLACRSGTELNDGTPVTDALDYLKKLDPDAKLVQAIGFNCCDIQIIPSLVRIAAADIGTCASGRLRRGIVVYPNTGEHWDAAAGWKEGTGCSEPIIWANRLLEVVDMVKDTWNIGVTQPPLQKIIIGGCCRTTPETIGIVRKLLDERQRLSSGLSC